MDKVKANSTTLGIDLGPNSIGWALFRNDKSNKPGGLIATGTRVFHAGLDDLEMDGRGKSRNSKRREARSRRRLLERRRRRMTNLAIFLRNIGLFPEIKIEDSGIRHEFLKEYDLANDQPYTLRAKGLDHKLEPYELGRALYHHGQRRGFLSNRKSAPKDTKEEKGIKKEIGELAGDIIKKKARTLGEYFSMTEPISEPIRGRYTSRKMYIDEFEQIWSKQSEFYPDILNEENRKKIFKIIFHQRPLKSQKHLIGECELEPNRFRAPWGILKAQRFRYLQLLCNLTVADDARSTQRPITDEEFELLQQNLELHGDITFAQARRLLGLGRFAKFNLELGGEKRIIGNKISAKLAKIFGEEIWSGFTEDKQNKIAEDLRCINNEDILKSRGINVWGLNEEGAEKLSQIKLEDGYCRFSRQAIDRLLPMLERRVSLQTAIRELYPERWDNEQDRLDFLPPVSESGLPALRNPIVERTLTELRKVVNSIIAQYGKPNMIRIELARDLKQSGQQREKASRKIRANQRAREKAAKKIIEETGIENPTREDILKVLLAEECNWICPYTRKNISIGSILGDNPQFDIEHIIPFDRSLDDSFLNKTLCDAVENRKVKKNRTPFEAYHGSARWDEIVVRLSDFKSDVKFQKLRRFKMTPEEVQKELEGFTARQLNDTRWASRWAKQYLGLLYSGIKGDGIDAEGKRKVQAVGGPVTAHLRNQWNLNSILSDSDIKGRDDHRHHAVDAVVVGLTDAGSIKKLSGAAVSGYSGRKKFKEIEPPWDGFLEEVRNKIQSVTTSHRLSRRVRGAMHQESFYGKPRKDKDGKTYIHIRKPLESLSKKELKYIVDPVISDAIKTKLKELKQDDPKKAFADIENHPVLSGNHGKKTPIHRVRVRMNLSETFPVGKNHRTRHVLSDSNHHIEIVESTDPENEKINWEGLVVSLFEAYQRKKNGTPIVRREFGVNKKFLFSLANGDIIELDNAEGTARGLFIVRTVPKSKQIKFVPINDARAYKQDMWGGLTAKPDSLRRRRCRKLTVTPLGDVRTAND